MSFKTKTVPYIRQKPKRRLPARHMNFCFFFLVLFL